MTTTLGRLLLTLHQAIWESEWAAYSAMAPVGMGGPSMGSLPSCPVCGGVRPSELADRNFIAEAIGHKPECIFHRAPNGAGEASEPTSPGGQSDRLA